MVAINSQYHGYKSGHQLIESTLKLEKVDQDVVDRLSDIAGPLRPGEIFQPYLTAYLLPSGKYYVLANTIQDLESPRAGCVKTHSLFIPIEYWKHKADPGYLAHILEEGIPRLQTFHLDEYSQYQIKELPTVDFNGFNELIEAIFLERRNSVVMFDVPMARIAAIRLLAAMWPGLRGQFSICTFALSPRYINNKSFDLIFSTKSARPRFSDWDGRRIEFSNSGTTERHRWTKQIAEGIFAGHYPRLLDIETVNLLNLKDEKNESALRLGLLWNELAVKANAGLATAVLGMIDIANSRFLLKSVWPSLKILLVNVLANPAHLDLKWEEVEALLQKLDPEFIDFEVNTAINQAAQRLSIRDWKSSFDFLLRANSAKIPVSVLRSIAETLVDKEPEGLSNALLSTPIDKLISLVIMDADFLEIMLSRLADNEVNHFERLLSLITHIPENNRFYLFKGYLKYVDGNGNLELLKEVIRYALPYQLIEAATELWDSPVKRTLKIGCFLCEKAHELGAVIELRNLFATFEIDSVTLSCISILCEDIVDIPWLLTSRGVIYHRPTLLDNVITKISAPKLKSAFKSEYIIDQSIKILSENIARHSVALVKLLTLSNESTLMRLELAWRIYPDLENESDLKRLSAWLLSHFSEIKSSEIVNPNYLFKSLFENLTLDTIYKAFFDKSLSGEAFSANLIFLATVEISIRKVFIGDMDRVVDYLLNRGRFDLTFEGAKILSGFLSELRMINSNSFIRLSARLLPLALSSREGSSSELLKVIFPPVYNELANDNDFLGLIKSFMFVDWDKCKTARKDLVRAFMNSSWPGIDFLLITIECQDPERIIKSLLKEPKGDKYLNSILKNIDSLDSKSIEAVEKYLKRLSKNDMFD